MDKQRLLKLQKLASLVRQDLVRMHTRGGSIASAMSIVDLLVALYFEVMVFPDAYAPGRDRLLLSKGHGVSAIYSVLRHLGVVDRSVVGDYLADGSLLTAHPTRGAKLGIEMSSGSLGHGLAVAIGLALALGRDQLPCRIFTILGDGELQEGSIWEAAILGARLRLANLAVIVDVNNLQGYDRVDEMLPLASLPDKWRSFGWRVVEIDGHDFTQITKAFSDFPNDDYRPLAILARTVKGKGVKEMEDELGWHYFNVPAGKVEAYVSELEID